MFQKAGFLIYTNDLSDIVKYVYLQSKHSIIDTTVQMSIMVDTGSKYFAFISYNSKDIRWGKKLQRKLEHYRMPATLCSERGWTRTPIRPVFFAPTDIQPGGLTTEIQERLRASRHLIVICSPNSAKSEWVGKEIAFFHEIGRTKDIHFFIVDGVPHSGNEATECFNPIVEQLGLPEILGANVNEKIFRWRWLNRERAYVQLISKLLEVEYDSIWRRHRRIVSQKITAWIVGMLSVILSIIGVWVNAKPVDVLMQLNETSFHNDYLPPLKDAVVTMELDNEVKMDTIVSLDQPLVFKNIPHRFLRKPVRVSVPPYRGYTGVDTMTTLRRKIIINVCRDSLYFGSIKFHLWDPWRGHSLEGVRVEIAGRSVCSDKKGVIQLYVPLKEQRMEYPILTEVTLECDTVYMPCLKLPAIAVKY